VLVLFGAVSLWLVGVDVVSAAVHGRVWTGTDGLYLPDQLQYVAWIRDASKHVLISDLFVLNPTPHDYLQPAIAISGGLTALGVAPWLSLLLWKPVAVLAVFFAVRAFCRRMLPGRWPQRTALVLAIFYGSFGTYPAVDESLPFLSWGYPFTLMATAALVAALLGYARARDRGGLTWAAPLLGLLASWFHPWQGEVLILVVLGGEALSWGGWQRVRERLPLAALTIGATAVPLAYYGVLDHADPAWRLGRIATLTNQWSLWRSLYPLLPLIAVAALGYRKRPRTFMAAAVRVWPLATLVVFELSKRLFAATPLHAFTGVTVPLAVLAVQGVQELAVLRRIPRARLVALLAVAAATIPATVHMMDVVRSQLAPASNGIDFISHSEQRALDYLRADPKQGGVLTDFILGAVVPGETGRRTYLGNCDWSVPHCVWRWSNTWHVFLWKWVSVPHHYRGWYARWLIRRSGARFVLASCHSHVFDFESQLRPILVAVHHFGCATVYEVRPGHRYLI
jgi:hypothetical protein